MEQFEFRSSGLDDTRRLGQSLGRHAVPGLVVALSGTLGAGKTAFVRAVAEGLDIGDPLSVTSPTFILVHEYAARLPVYHFDTYRLRTELEFAELGAHEYFDGDGVCLVEWADRVPSVLPPERFDIAFSIVGDTERRIDCRCVGNRYLDLFLAWKAMVA